MNTTTKKKLCWNCEGNVARDATNCIYCGVYLQREEESESEEEDLTPPYTINTEEEEKEVTFQAPYTPQEGPLSKEMNPELFSKTKEENPWKKIVLAQITLSLAALLTIFGLTLLSFSKDGVLTLRWDGEFWPYYLFLAAPLFLIGIRALKVEPER